MAELAPFAGGASATDPGGNEVLPFDLDNPLVYIECLGEIGNRHVVGETRHHEPSTTCSGRFLCFRARSREHIDALHGFLVVEGVKVVNPPEDGPWAPGYCSVLFEDPEGIQLGLPVGAWLTQWKPGYAR